MSKLTFLLIIINLNVINFMCKGFEKVRTHIGRLIMVLQLWANGFDIAPEYLFFLANKNNLEYKELFTKWGYLP